MTGSGKKLENRTQEQDPNSTDNTNARKQIRKLRHNEIRRLPVIGAGQPELMQAWQQSQYHPLERLLLLVV